jgi:hypothetical protein
MNTDRNPKEVAMNATNISRTDLFTNFKQQGYWMKYAAAATLVVGIYLHVTSLLIGRDLFLQHVLTARFDMFFAIPMTYAGISGWLAWKRVIHPGLWHRVIYGFLTVYFTISIPLHAQTFIKGSTDFFRLFPEGYSLFSIPLMIALLVFVWRLKFKADVE